VSSRKRTPKTSDIQIEIQKASHDVAEKLGLPAGAVVVSRHERRFLDRTPWSMLTSFYPMDFVVRGALRLTTPEDIPEGTVKYLADTLGIHQMGYRDSLAVRTPDGNEADYFKLPPDGRTSIVEISRTAFDGNGQPMRLTVSVYPADRNQFVIDFGQVPEQEKDQGT
jgi:GntR family transcriptional regulator